MTKSLNDEQAKGVVTQYHGLFTSLMLPFLHVVVLKQKVLQPL